VPKPDHTTKLRTRTGLLLKVAVVAWLSIMVMPCTILAASPLDTEPTVAEASQQDCHGMHADADFATPDCCCDPLSITSGEAPKSQRVDLVAATPLAHAPMLTLSLVTTTDNAHPPPQVDAGPPVYLTTQRFRI
jgi:hypothetical protein